MAESLSSLMSLFQRVPIGNPNLERFGNQGFKRNGWLGPIPVNGGYATEYSIGARGEMPSIVPTLTDDELALLVKSINDPKQPFPESVDKKAQDFAAMRLATGQSPFAGDNDSPVPTRHPGPWRDEYVMPNPQSGMLNALLLALRNRR